MIRAMRHVVATVTAIRFALSARRDLLLEMLALLWSANIPSGETWRFICSCRPNELACAA
jgi:hypothetical protein